MTLQESLQASKDFFLLLLATFNFDTNLEFSPHLFDELDSKERVQ